MSFIERLQQAARNAGATTSQAGIALALGVNRQTVHRWFKGGEPDADQLIKIATRFNVDAKWLKEGDGQMMPKPGGDLSHDERELITNYRQATPKVREVVRMMTRAVRKAIVAGVFSIPPLLAPKDGHAAFNNALIARQAHQESTSTFVVKPLSVIRLVHDYAVRVVNFLFGRGFLTPAR